MPKWYILGRLLLAFNFFLAKEKSRNTAGSSAHWEVYHSPLSFRVDLERGCITTALHLLVMPAYGAETFKMKPGFSLPLSVDYRELPVKP